MDKPVVGQGVTLPVGTDRYPGTIIEVSASGKRIVIQKDKFKRTDKNGWSESQEYAFSPNPKAKREEYSLRKDGTYIRKGIPMDAGFARAFIGERSAYMDPGF